MPFAEYTGVIGKTIGSLIGAYFGGPAGAYAGGMAGEMEGGKFGDVLKGDSDFTTLFSPGPAPQKPPAPPMPPTLLDPQGRTGNRAAPEMGVLRSPYEGEVEYFARNPNVTGMATEDDRVILNPFSSLSDSQKRSVVQNESARIWMRRNPVPSFAVTPEQRESFAGTDYAGNNEALRQTIIARIVSNDPSAGNVTDEQLKIADSVRSGMGTLNAPATRANMAEPTNGGGGFDWGGLISGVGRTLSGTAAGMRGDSDYFTRLQAQMDNAAERAKRTKLAEDELRAREEDRAVTRSKNLMETLKMANDVADQIGGDPERARLPARMLKTILEKNLDGGTIDEKEMQDFLAKGSGAFDGILAAYTGITAAGLDKTPGFQQALRKGKIDLKEWNKTGREQMSNVAYQAAAQFAKEHPEDAKKMTWDQFQAKIPGAEFASEEDIYRLQQEHGYTIKPPAQLKKEAERTAGGDTRTALSAARLITNRDITKLEDLTPDERKDLLAYEDAPKEVQTQLNMLKQKNPNARISDLLSQAVGSADQRKVNVSVNIAGGAAQAAVQGRERGYQNVINERLDRITREKEAEAAGRPLDQPDRAAISAMEKTVKIAGQIKDEFTPEELKKYIGQFKRPLAQLKELARADPKFERLNTLIMEIKGTAFAEGGKQLTPYEAGITFGHIPTGDEFSTEQFITKLDTTVEQTTALIQERYRKATTGRGRLTPNLPQPKPGGAGQPTANRPRRRNPQTGEVVEFDGKAWVKVQ